LDLLVLKEVVAKMGGIEVVEDLTELQLQAQAGGEALRFESSPIKVFTSSLLSLSPLLSSLPLSPSL
jgi:hypothetical protein